VEFIVVARGEMPPPRLGYHLHVVNGEHPASSTELRNLVYEKSFSTPWLAPAVKDYIQRHQLYIGGR
jgi:nicotinic acid mononucleotide adenylyltransferase